MKTFVDYIKAHAILIIICIILCGGMAYMYHKDQVRDEELHKAQIITSQQAQDLNALENRLHISRSNAEALQHEVERAQADRMKPDTHIIVQAPNIPAAEKIVEDRIEERDPTLPPEALEKTDRTVVVDQPKNKDYKVGIYKINLRRNWDIGVGVGTYNHQFYQAYAIQRNYDKRHAISVQANFQGPEYKGCQVMWHTSF